RQSPNDLNPIRAASKSPPLRGGSAMARRPSALIPRLKTGREHPLQANSRHASTLPGLNRLAGC
ncbi:MAG: hypothetical protein QNJ44_03725, partial [Rhodobacter sp.]|nr:hypothetical protein [Rhodobacter sp.]